MLQIRLIKGGSSAEGGGGAAKSPVPVETVTVACPDHLVLADLPVAKSLGVSNASYASSAVKSVGRRSRRHLGERVHFCVCCDYPIAIYGRLIPCEHSFCLACARSDSSCYLCDERIQKIQTIKMMEGIYICAAPHCLKTFLKKAEFESHIHETHADLLHPNMEREGGNESDGFNITRHSSAETHAKQSILPEYSTAQAPQRLGFSVNSQVQDRDDKARHHQSREQTPLRPPLQPRQQPFHAPQQPQPAESQPDSNTPSQGTDRPYNWFAQPQSFDNQSGSQYRRESDQFPQQDKNMGVPQESSFPEYPPLYAHQLSTYPMPIVVNPGLNPPPSFSYPGFPAEGSQHFYSMPYEMPRPEMVPEGGSEPGSLLGFPPVPGGTTGNPDNFPRPWNTGLMGMQFEPSALGQGVSEGYINSTDSQARAPFFRAEFACFPEGLAMNPILPVKEPELQGGSGDQNDGQGVLVPLQPPLTPLSISLPPPPPPLPSHPHKRGRFSDSSDAGRDGLRFGRQNENRRFGNRPD